MIDTRQKRFSMLGIGQPWVPTLPVPDGTINQAEREERQFAYTGILWERPVIPVFDCFVAVVDLDVGYYATVMC